MTATLSKTLRKAILALTIATALGVGLDDVTKE